MFGMHPDFVFKLITFLPIDTIIKMLTVMSEVQRTKFVITHNLTNSQIYQYVGYHFAINYPDKVDWSIFLPHYEVDNRLIKHKNIHKYLIEYNTFINKYTIDCLKLPQCIIWDKFTKCVSLPGELIIRHWNKIPRENLYTHYIDNIVLIEKKDELDWNKIIRKQHVDEWILDTVNNLNWELVILYQNISPEFLDKHIHYLLHYYLTTNLLDCYILRNDLPEWFILKHHKILNMNLVSRVQNLSYSFIKQHADILNCHNLTINQNYNKKNGIQIFYRHNKIILLFIDETNNCECCVIR